MEGDSVAVQRVLNYLYTTDHDDRRAENPASELSDGFESPNPLQNSVPSDSQPETPVADETNLSEIQIDNLRLIDNIHVYVLADKYEIPELMDKAEDEFRSLLHLLDANVLKGEVIREVYETTWGIDLKLKNVVAQDCAANMGSVQSNNLCSKR